MKRGWRTTVSSGRWRSVKTDDHELAIEGEKQEDKGCRRSVTSRQSSAEGQTRRRGDGNGCSRTVDPASAAAVVAASSARASAKGERGKGSRGVRRVSAPF